MALLGFRDVHFQFSGVQLLAGIHFQIERGERVCLTGRNGAGKSTLMKLILGEHEPDSGAIIKGPSMRIAHLPQDVPGSMPGTVLEIVREGATHHEQEGDWKADIEAERWVDRAGLPADALFDGLSGGQKRRVLLCKALAGDPDLLLLDEPTNHLDLESIEWMEEVLQGSTCALLFVTHDRAFLKRLSRRILELDRGRLFDWDCDWETFLSRKEEQLAAEEKASMEFDKVLAQEEVWIRRGLKARRTRNEGRVRRLEAMRNERAQRRDRTGSVQLRVEEAERSGKLVARMRDVNFAWGERQILSNVSLEVQRGDRIGILGPNGSGKTTFLRVLLGQLEAQSGLVHLGTNLEVLYFDQMRAELPMDALVREAIAEGRDTVTIAGRSQHVMSYLKNFLFGPEKAMTKVSALSGGEKNRLLLARMFTRAANVLVLDEPTNDLDADTLDLLEELLSKFEGTVLLVSHDRSFLDEVATSIFAIEPDGSVSEHVGGYTDWLRTRKVQASAAETARKDAEAEAARIAAEPPKKKLSYKDARELEMLPDQIEKLEAQAASQSEAMADPAFYRKGAAEIAKANQEATDLARKIAMAYARWEELTAQAG
ncbi:MAG: transporter ATP-binding protein uup [Fibrobacterota bacterium]|jgi:ATP-binding cassette subfamily F protein uup